MGRHIPLIISEGEAFERGFHLGRTEAARVSQTVNAYMRIFKEFANLNREDVFALAERYIPIIDQYTLELVEEMRGIARGAERDLREIVAINARTELMYGGHMLPECTSIALSGWASADGCIRLAQNWDWHPSLAGALVLWVLKPAEGRYVLTLTEAGIVGKIGTNLSLAMCVNLLTSDSDSPEPAIPMHVILRHVLDTASWVDEAIDLIDSLPRSTSCNHLLADRAGSLASVEATPASQRVLYSSDGWLTHTNHCLSPELAARDSYVRQYPETLARNERAQELASQIPIDEQSLHTLMADHATAPGSICLHVRSDASFTEQNESVASIIFNLTAGTVDIAEGPPCAYEYRRIRVDDVMSANSDGDL